MNELLIPDDEIIFNREVLHVGDFIRAKAKGQNFYRNGLISFVGKETLKALVFNGTSTAASYLKIAAADVANNLWEIKVSSDLEEIYYGGVDSEETSTEP